MRQFLSAICVFLFSAFAALGQDKAPRNPGTGPYYPVVHTRAETRQVLRIRADGLNVDELRAVFRSGKHVGQRGLTNMFNNLEGPMKPDLKIPGMSGLISNIGSDNRSVAKGARRTFRYAQLINADPRFQVIAVEQMRKNRFGRTDADIVVRDTNTGKQIRIEVKDMLPTSQRANFNNIAKQIGKMALDQRNTSEIQVLANRQRFNPEIKALAQKNGILVWEEVSTSAKQFGKGKTPLDGMLNDLHQRSVLQTRLKSWGHGVEAGMGAYLLLSDSKDVFDDLRRLRASEGMKDHDLLLFGEHVSRATSRAGILARGTTNTRSYFPSTFAGTSKLAAIGKWGGRLGLVGTGAAQGFVFWQYAGGYMTKRESYRNTARLLGGALPGGLAGAWAGTKAGALIGGTIGSVVPGKGTAIGVVIGGFVGGVSGGFAGASAGEALADSGTGYLFELQDNAQAEELRRFVYRLYGVD